MSKVKQIDGQESLFDPGIAVKKDCNSCACCPEGSYGHYLGRKQCLWASLPDSSEKQCPEAEKRKPEDIRRKNPTEFDLYMWNRWWCSGCGGYDNETGKWREHDFHRFMCPSYLPTTHRTEKCLLYDIQAWDMPDGSTIKWCAECEANGCEDCYKKSSTGTKIKCKGKDCKYFCRTSEEEQKKFMEEHPNLEFPEDFWDGCDFDQISLDAADELEKIDKLEDDGK